MRCGKKLGKLDRLIKWKRPQPHAGSKDECKQLPKTLEVRVRLKIQSRGFRDKWLWANRPSHKESLAELYQRRWQAELFIRDLKTTMGMDELRCKTPDGAQESSLCLPSLTTCFAYSWPMRQG